MSKANRFIILRRATAIMLIVIMSLTMMPISSLADTVPNDTTKSNLDIVAENLWDGIKGLNTDQNAVTEEMVQPVCARVENGDVSAFRTMYGNYNVKIEWNVDSEYIHSSYGKFEIVNRPTVDTKVTFNAKLKASDDENITKDASITVTLKGEKPAEFNPLDKITAEELFKSIRGENTDKTNITKALTLYENSTLYAAATEDGTVAWKENAWKTNVKISKWTLNTDQENLIIKDGQPFIASFPTEDKQITLTASLISIGDYASKNLKKDVELTVTLKGEKPAEFNPLDNITTEELFKSIRGENTDKTNITKALTPDSNKTLFAKATEDGLVKWMKTSGWGDNLANVEIKWTVNSDEENLIIKNGQPFISSFPTEDKQVILTASLKGVRDYESKDLKKDVELTVTLKGVNTEEDLIEKELQGYLDKYLSTDYIKYITVEREGVDFVTDYVNHKVRYNFAMPKITALEGIPYGEIKTKIISSDDKAVNFKYRYNVEPIRGNVGGQEKTVTLTYSLTKDETTVSKDFTVVIPALTQDEIDEELKALEKIKLNIFDGFKYDNFDKENVSDSLSSFSEVHWDEKGDLVWVQGANDSNKQYFGFKLPPNDSYDITYKNNAKAVFSATNLVLNERPLEDVTATISNTLDSILLSKYADLYKDNKDLQKLNNVPISFDVIVKKIDANANKFTVAGHEIQVKKGVTKYSVLTDKTLENTNISVELNNKSSNLIIAGKECTNLHQRNIELVNGYVKAGITVSDEDSKQEGTKVTNNYKIAVVSKKYLENAIIDLPDSPDTATQQEKNIVASLLLQYDSLTDEDKVKITGKNKLESYRTVAGDPLAKEKAQVNKVCTELFEGIKAENPSKDQVSTNLAEIYYAQVTEDGIVWTKTADNSDVVIEWGKSSAPEYINTHDGNDFNTGYVEAFNIRQRPGRKTKDLDVTFDAKVTHLRENSITQNTAVTFTLKEYNANLEKLSISEVPKFTFDKNKTDYEILYKSILDEVTLDISPEINSVKVSVDGKRVNFKETVKVRLNEKPQTITIKVNDEIKNTLNGKWDEKEYRLTFTQNLSGEVDKKQLKEKLAEAKGIDVNKYIEESVKAFTLAIENGDRVLAKTDAIQSEVNAATKALMDTLKALVEIPKADKNELNELLNNVMWLNQSGYAESSWNVFELALKKAIKDNNTPYIQQSEVDATKKSLEEARNNLVRNEGKETTYTESTNIEISLGGTSKDKNIITFGENTRVKKATMNFTTGSDATVLVKGIGSTLPEVVINRESRILTIPKGAFPDENVGVEALNPINDMVKGVLKRKLEKKVNDPDKIVSVFDGYSFKTISTTKKSGNMQLSQYAKITFKGMADKSVMMFGNDGTMSEVGTSKTENIYITNRGKDLIVNTKILNMNLQLYVVNSTDIDNGDGDTPAVPSGKFVTVSVDLKTINKGYLVSPTKVEIRNNDTVWNVLKKVARDNNLSIDYRKSPMYDNGVYVAGINGVGEFDHGQGSGWMYNVDRTYPEYTCDQYTLNGGENIQWRYTKKLGEDLGDSASKVTNGGGGGITVENPKKENVTGSTTVEATINKNGNATVTVPSKNITVAIDNVVKEAEKADDKDVLKEVQIAVQVDSKATSIETTLSKASLKELKKKVDVVTVKTKIADISLDSKTLEGIVKNTEGDLKVTVAKVDVEKTILVDKKLSVEDKESFKKEIGSRPVFDFSMTAGKQKVSNYAGKVEVSVPYTPLESEKPNSIVIYYVKDNGSIEMIKYCVYDENTNMVNFVASHFSNYAVGYKEVKFVDTKKHWAEDSIAFLASREIVKGTTKENFKPNSSITRAEFTKILASMSGADLGNYAVPNFSDVKADAWYAGSAAWAEKMGVITGIKNSNGTVNFNPNADIARADMAVMISRYMKNVEKKALNIESKEIKFNDKGSIAEYAKEAVKELQMAGIINGVKNSDKSYSFAPKNNATRAEASKMMSTLIHKNF